MEAALTAALPTPGVPIERWWGGWGGGGGMVAMPGADSGHTSRAGQGAWSTMKRLAGPRLRGPRGLRSPSRARTSRLAPWEADDFPLDAAGVLDAGARAAQPPGGLGEQPVGRGRGQLLHPGAGVALGTAAAQQTGERAVRHVRDVGRGDMQQHDVGVLGRVRTRGVDACGPTSLRWGLALQRVTLRLRAPRS